MTLQRYRHWRHVAVDAIAGRPQHTVLAAVVLGLAAGCHLPLAIVALVALMPAIVLRAPLAWMVALALVTAAMFATARVDALERSHLASLIGHVQRGDLTLLRSPRETAAGGWTVTARLGRDPVLVLAPARIAAALPRTAVGAGDLVTGLFAVAPADRFARAVHAHAVVRVFALKTTGRRRGGFSGLVDSVRRRAQRALDHGLPPAQAGLMRGMVLGDDSGLPLATRAEFRASGLSHLMAASGQNVVLLVALAVALASAVGVPFGVRWGAVLGLIAVYVPLAGGGPSIQRAGVMGAIGVLALVSARPATRGYALGLAGAVTLAVDPRAVADPGWQMSFAAVVGLSVLAAPWSKRLARAGVPSLLADALAVTASATLATAPIVAAHFGRASPVTLPANIIAAPVVAPIMWLGLLAAALGQLVPFAAVALDTAAAPLLGFLTAVAHSAATAPGAAVNAGVLPVSIACVAILSIAGVERTTRTRAGWAVVVVVLLGIVLLIARARSEPPLQAPAGLRITFLDIGQGDATLVQDGGSSVLVDAGPPGSPILERLRHAGIRRLDALVVTHAQADHEGGAASVLGAMDVGLVLDGRDGVRTDDGDRFAAVAARRHMRLVKPTAGAVLRAGRVALKILGPLPGPSTALTGDDPNQRAIVLELRDRGATLLLTSDAESDVLDRLDVGPVDLLKVSHHGSADRGLPALLTRLRPRAAVIEVGAHNTYGHPVARTVTELRRVATLYRTDRDGTVRADLEPAGWTFHVHS